MEIASFSPSLLRTGTDAAGMSPREAVEEFEAMLAAQLLKTAREAGEGLGEEETEAGSETYLEFAEQHLARAMARSGMLGFAKLLERDLGIQADPPGGSPPQPARAAFP